MADRHDAPTNGRNRERGETLIEFALSLTLYLMTLLGTAQFGILVFRYNVIADLAQEGARRAAVCGHFTGLSATDCDIQSFVRSRSLGISPSVNVTWSAGSADASLSGDTVLVRVQHTFTPLTRIVPLGTITLSSTAQMVVFR